MHTLTGFGGCLCSAGSKHGNVHQSAVTTRPVTYFSEKHKKRLANKKMGTRLRKGKEEGGLGRESGRERE